MANWMQDLQSIFNAAQGDNGPVDPSQEVAATRAADRNGGLGGLLGGYLNNENLTKLLGPTALGGLAGALMGGGSKNNIAQKVLLLGGGALGMLALDRYRKQTEAARAPQGGGAGAAGAGSNAAPSQVDERVRRLIQAMVFAARADGNLDADEHRAIEEKVKSLSLGADAERAVAEAMRAPVDPNALAAGVKNADEALELYIVSRSVVDVDQFMERNYLQALAKALSIPESVQQGIESDIAAAAEKMPVAAAAH